MNIAIQFIGLLSCTVAAAAEMLPPTRLLVSDHQPNRLAIVNTRSQELEWEYPCAHPQDVHWLADGTILAAVGAEAQIIKPDLVAKKGGEILWRVKPGGEVPVAQPLPDGGILIACSPGPKGLIIEFDKNRNVVRRIEVTTKTTGHSQFRFCRKTPQGTYLIPSIGDGILYEIDARGKEIWKLPLPQVCSAERLSNGSTLVAGGDAIRCYDRDYKESWVLTAKEMNLNPGILAGMHMMPLPNNNCVVANWGNKPEEASAVAIDLDRHQVLWRLNHPLIGKAAHVQVLPISAKQEKADSERFAQLIDSTASRLKLTSLALQSRQPRPALLAHWRNWIKPERIFLWNRGLKSPEGNIYDEHSLIPLEDRDALGTVLRRSRALLELRQKHSPESIPPGWGQDLERLEAEEQTTRQAPWTEREGLYYTACVLRRALILSDPLLAFDRLAFLHRGTWAGTRLTCKSNSDQLGGHFATQNFGFITKPGGGLWIASDWKTTPKLAEPLAGVTVQAGAGKGEKLTGSVHSLELSYDAKSFLFAHNFATAEDHRAWRWTPRSTWKIFRMAVDGSGLTQLTDGAYNDFDPCWLPDGNIAFVSERRGGFIRCFKGLRVPSYVLHRMRPDGTAIHPISFFETSEWNPSVNQDGRLLYARWDYTDREDCLGSTLWISAPDGCNPRSPHGNYPFPWSTRKDAEAYQKGPERKITAEMGIRAIPGSRKLICTVAPHHGEHYGSIGIIDLSRPDSDNGMEQMARVTPFQPFPESECADRSNYQYGTPWPLSEDLFLCTSWEDLVVLDRFGNEELILARGEVPRAMDDPAMRLCDPIPLAPRTKPPVLPELSNQWPDAPQANAEAARISIINVRDSDLPFPQGTNIRWLRLVQNFLKEDPLMDTPRIGYGDENTPRLSLGLVPVESDGSAHFFAPPNKELIFQLLDEDFRAVQSMRSVAFLHKGEHLSCLGCHEQRNHPPRNSAGSPLALRRPPSVPQAEPMGREPIIYARHIKPILERADLPCLGNPKKLEHKDLLPVTFHFAGGFRGNLAQPIHGGSRTIPGCYGARVSVLGNEAHAAWKAGKMAEADYRTLSLWLDCNSVRLGAYHGEAAQMAGKLVWPRLDLVPADPLGLEGQPGENTVDRIFRSASQLHPSDPGAGKRWRSSEPSGDN